jgi:ABC-type sugar transport system permease subunit
MRRAVASGGGMARRSGGPMQEQIMRRRNWLPYTVTMPSLILVLGIAIYPIGYAFYLSLTDRIMSRNISHFVGLQNYIDNQLY